MRTHTAVATLILLATTLASLHAQQTSPLKRKLVTTPQTTSSVNHASALLRQTAVWGGIENYDSDCAPTAEYAVPPLEGTLEDGLLQIRSQDNSLKWKVQDDGVLLTRHAPVNSLLDTNVPQISFYPRESPEKFADRLLNLPAVKDRMTDLQFTVRSPELGFAQRPVDTSSEEPVTLRRVTVRQALNAMAKADHPKVWLFHQIACGGLTTVTLQWVVK